MTDGEMSLARSSLASGARVAFVASRLNPRARCCWKLQLRQLGPHATPSQRDAIAFLQASALASKNRW